MVASPIPNRNESLSERQHVADTLVIDLQNCHYDMLGGLELV